MPLDDRDGLTPVRLGPRAHEVLELVLLGQTDGAIGERLALSPISVEHYRRAIMHARGVATTPKLLALVWGERVAALEAAHAREVAALTSEIARLERSLRLLLRQVDEADNRRFGPADRRGELGPA